MSKKMTFSLCFYLLLVSSAIVPSTFAASVVTDGDLDVYGWIWSHSGGFKFPDGSTWTSGDMSGLLFNVGFDVDNSNSNAGNLNSGAIKFGAGATGEAIASQRIGSGNKNCLDFYTNSTSRLAISNDGKVGIGTRTPAQALDVVGNINASGSVSGSSGNFSGSTGNSLYCTSNTGVPGFFQITNASNSTNALTAQSNGSGDSFYSWTSGSGNAILGNNTGTGSAGAFSIGNINNTSNALYAVTNGKGAAGFFQVNNASNTTNALTAQTNGLGDSLYSYTSGSGSAILGNTTGTGRAGAFTLNNNSSNATALYASTTGTGNALSAQTSGSGDSFYSYTSGSGSAILGNTTGTGRAGAFTINNATNNADSLYASTSGTGYSGEFVGGAGVRISGNLQVTGSINAGPGATHMPLAYGFFVSNGTKQAGSSNISCSWNATSSWYECLIPGEPLGGFFNYVCNVTPAVAGSNVAIPKIDGFDNKLVIIFYNLSGTLVQPYGFSLTIYKP